LKIGADMTGAPEIATEKDGMSLDLLISCSLDLLFLVLLSGATDAISQRSARRRATILDPQR
jgi:hypothetical protein